MIKTLGNTSTVTFLKTGKSKFRGLDVDKAYARIRLINEMISLSELAQAKRLRLHALKGDLKGFWAIDINGPWRLIFQWRGQDAYEVQIIDYH
jgi:proteic killer suppression protein